MTTRYTNDEWRMIISQAENEVFESGSTKTTTTSETCACPTIGSLEFSKTIDHTLLKLDAKPAQFDELCAEARVNRFASVCVRPQWVKQCVSNLKGTDIKVASVIGFHEGTYDLLHKLEETKKSLESGASELDIVINYPQLKTGRDYANIYNELATLRSQAPHPVLLKLILETSQLTDHEILAGCVIAAAANFDFVKTSTGFNGHGATEEHVHLMATCCMYLASLASFSNPGGFNSTNPKKMQVKASGGVRTLEDAVKMLSAGAGRLGTSAGVWIAKEARESVERNGGRPPESDSNDLSRPGLTTRLFTDY